LAAIFFLFLWFVNNYFSVKKIEISGNSDQKIISGIGLLKEKNIFLLDPAKEGDFLLRANPWLKKVTLTKIYPHTLRLNLEKNEPVAALEVREGFFLLAKNGTILFRSKAHYAEYPVIRYFQKFNYDRYQAGERINYQDLLLSLDFISTVRSLGYQINSIDINSNDMIALNLVEKGRKVIFSSEKDAEEQIYMAKLILPRFRTEGKDFRSIDLRFDKPIVKLK